jgi:hypothetical protein
MGASLHGARARSQRGTLYRRLQQYAAGFSARVDAGSGSALARCIEGAFDTFIHRGFGHGSRRLRCGDGCRRSSPG